MAFRIINYSLEPRDVLQSILKMIVLHMKICFCNILEPNFRVRPINYFIVSIVLWFGLCAVNTIMHYDNAIWIQCISFAGIVSQGLCKNVTVLLHHPDLRYFIEFVDNIYRCNAHECPAKAVLRRTSINVRLICGIFGGILFISVWFILLLPFVMKLFTNVWSDMLPFYLPYIDEKTVHGYLVHTVLHACLAIMGYVGSVASDLLCIVVLMQLWPISDIFALSVNSLNDTMHRSDAGSSVNRILIRIQLRNILLMHKDIYNFTAKIRKVFYMWFSIEVFTSQMSMVLMIYLVMTSGYVIGYFMGTIFFGKLFLYCIFGTVFETMSHKICTSVNEIQFYLLPVADQRMVMTMLMMAQRPNLLMAGVTPLNLDTFVNVMNTVYQCTMLLKQTV